MSRLSFAVCTYNRAAALAALLPMMRAQACPVPFEVLVIDNNSDDDTPAVVERERARGQGAPLRYVREPRQGISFARNRAIDEALDHDWLVFMDDDEHPHPGLLAAAFDALEREGADCVGGAVTVAYGDRPRPRWLDDELEGFLAALDHGRQAFWIKQRDTPIWTANIGYRMALFRDDPGLRFDPRYSRRGAEVGGGEDAILFRALLERGARIRYRPDMRVVHHVEPWRLRRRYFLHLHFVAGRRYGQYQMREYPRTVCGVPLFLGAQLMSQSVAATAAALRRRPGALRQAMNAAHTLGAIWGRGRAWRGRVG